MNILKARQKIVSKINDYYVRDEDNNLCNEYLIVEVTKILERIN